MTRKTYASKKRPSPNPRMADEAPMRLKRLRIKGMRTLADVTLDLCGLTVLIGDNGSGKSSILEACEILRRAATAPDFSVEFGEIHGGISEIRRSGQPAVQLLAALSNGCQYAEYQIVLGAGGILREFLLYGGTNLSTSKAVYLDGDGDGASVFDEKEGTVRRTKNNRARTFLASESGMPHQSVFRAVARVLGDIEVHLPFDVTARWIARESRRPAPMRESRIVEPAARLSRLGENLANSYAWLKDRPGDHWAMTMDWVRLGLGFEIESVVTEAQPGGGAIALSLRYKSGKVIPAYALSDGMLAYLAFVAVFRSNGGDGLLAFDEPESHLHPGLLARVVDFMESEAERRPVLVATQSDALVDHLQDPAAAVVLCELDEKGATQLVRPDRVALSRWLDRYRGLGDIRAAGHQRSVMQDTPLPKLHLRSGGRRRKG
jgi:predicted ATPase